MAPAGVDPAFAVVDFLVVRAPLAPLVLLLAAGAAELPEAAPPPDGVAVGAVSGVLLEKPSGGAVPTASAVSRDPAMPLEMVALVTQLDELGVLAGAAGVMVSPTVYDVGCPLPPV